MYILYFDIFIEIIFKNFGGFRSNIALLYFDGSYKLPVTETPTRSPNHLTQKATINFKFMVWATLISNLEAGAVKTLGSKREGRNRSTSEVGFMDDGLYTIHVVKRKLGLSLLLAFKENSRRI